MSNTISRSPLSNIQRRSGASTQTTSTRKSAFKALNEADRRLISEILANEQDYIDSDEFREAGAEERIYDEAPDIRKPDASWYSPVMNDLGINKARLPRSSDQVILTGAEERVIFLQYNFARFRVAEIRDEILATPDRIPTEQQAHDLLRWYRKSRVIREQIAETNLALVLAMAKRTRMSEVDFADLVSEGNMALLRAVDKFDAGRGFKFSTYACRAIIKAFSRQGMKLSKYRQRFPTDFDPKLERSNFVESKREEFLADSASGEADRRRKPCGPLRYREDRHRAPLSSGRRIRFAQQAYDARTGRADHRCDQRTGPPDPEQGARKDPY
jgi:RNA polymerase primary sigma factor